MQLVSVNVGLPREVLYKGRPVRTGIFKEPVPGRIQIRALNLEGDGQADLSVHGGPSKAVYAYPAEHYEYWRQELPGMELPWGMFGENLTTMGLREDRVGIGDRFRIGSAEVMVTEPRLPCYKLGLRFGRDDIVKRFLQSGRTGFYLAVLREGEVGAGDRIEAIARDENHVTVPDITRLYLRRKYNRDDRETLRRILQLQALPEAWRSHFAEKLRALARPGTRWEEDR
jgi:MOSC domain-containing protein YiiM